MSGAIQSVGTRDPGSGLDPRARMRVFADAPLALDGGGTLDGIEVAYETWGRLDAGASNAVLLLHALTGDSHAAGPAGPFSPTPGWWEPLVGPGRALDTDRFFVVCPNVLGGCRGTTGPRSLAADGRPYGSRFPAITIRDQVAVEAALADALGIERFHAVVGGSLGGMRALEWCVGHPERVARAVVLATCAAATAEQIALCSLQERIIRLDPEYRDGDYEGAGPKRGLAIARGLAQLSYRTEKELEARFGRARAAPEGSSDRYAVESYLEHHGEKLVRRFDASSYVLLSRAMSAHDVGRGRGGVREALARVPARVSIVGIASDRLHPLALQEALAIQLPRVESFVTVESIAGHDGFLLEHRAVGAVLRRALARPA